MNTTFRWYCALRHRHIAVAGTFFSFFDLWATCGDKTTKNQEKKFKSKIQNQEKKLSIQNQEKKKQNPKNSNQKKSKLPIIPRSQRKLVGDVLTKKNPKLLPTRHISTLGPQYRDRGMEKYYCFYIYILYISYY